ncbi:MAG: 2-dehydropantoate 2-reductase, partial [Thermoplasmata archaeon]|nr:2-dehydropantoate 2-reductase [Thermoplasmata archaeon]
MVFGAGAVGSLLGARLSRGGHHILLVARREHVEEINAHGLHVEGQIQGTFPLEAATDLPDRYSTDALLLTVKSYDLATAGAQIARRLLAPTPILALGNGLEIEPLLLEGLSSGGWARPQEWVVRGVNSIPATLLGPGRVRQAGEGDVA